MRRENEEIRMWSEEFQPYKAKEVLREIKTPAILAFCGLVLGLVTLWYFQSVVFVSPYLNALEHNTEAIRTSVWWLILGELLFTLAIILLRVPLRRLSGAILLSVIISPFIALALSIIALSFSNLLNEQFILTTNVIFLLLYPIGLSLIIVLPRKDTLKQFLAVLAILLITSVIVFNPAFAIFQYFFITVFAMMILSLILPWTGYIGGWSVFYGGESGMAALIYQYYFLLAILIVSIVAVGLGLYFKSHMEEEEQLLREKRTWLEPLLAVTALVILVVSLWSIGIGAGLIGTNFNEWGEISTGWEYLQILLSIGGGIPGSIALCVVPVSIFCYTQSKGERIRHAAERLISAPGFWKKAPATGLIWMVSCGAIFIFHFVLSSHVRQWVNLNYNTLGYETWKILFNYSMTFYYAGFLIALAGGSLIVISILVAFLSIKTFQTRRTSVGVIE